MIEPIKSWLHYPTFRQHLPAVRFQLLTYLYPQAEIFVRLVKERAAIAAIATDFLQRRISKNRQARYPIPYFRVVQIGFVNQDR